MNKKIISQIKTLAMIVGVPILVSSCSCSDKNNNPAGPSTDKPTLIEAKYPEYSQYRAVTGKLEYKGIADSAIVNTEDDGRKVVPINNKDSTVSISLQGADGKKSIITKIIGPGGESEADTSYTTLITSKPKANSIIIPAYTSTRNIEARLQAEKADSMNIGEDLSGQKFIPYGLLSKIALSPAEGRKTVYVVFKDKAGNLSDTISAITNLDITSPSVPIAFKDTTVNDNKLNLNFLVDGLIKQYYKMWGATADSGSLATINNAQLNEGLTYVMIYEQDSAGNIVQDTMKLTATKLSSAQAIKKLLEFYSGKGLSPADSGKQFTVTDSLTFKAYADTADYIFKVGNTKHWIRAKNNPSQEILTAADHTTAINKMYEFPDRFFISGKEFESSLQQKISDFYGKNKQ
jgi:hypothetical protein